MDKFQVAHEWAMKTMEKSRPFMSTNDLVKSSWQYADAMQAEADNRKEKGIPESLKPHEHNWENVTVMGDNVAKFVCADCGAVKHDVLEWQPDWDNIPDGFDWWAMDKKGKAYCFDREPVIDSPEWVMVGSNSNYQSSLTFNYQGDWRNSLRKRPQ